MGPLVAPRKFWFAAGRWLFAHRLNLLTRLDLVLMDATSLYFEGAGNHTLGHYGTAETIRPIFGE